MLTFGKYLFYRKYLSFTLQKHIKQNCNIRCHDLFHYTKGQKAYIFGYKGAGFFGAEGSSPWWLSLFRCFSTLKYLFCYAISSFFYSTYSVFFVDIRHAYQSPRNSADRRKIFIPVYGVCKQYFGNYVIFTLTMFYHC